MRGIGIKDKPLDHTRFQPRTIREVQKAPGAGQTGPASAIEIHRPQAQTLIKLYTPLTRTSPHHRLATFTEQSRAKHQGLYLSAVRSMNKLQYLLLPPHGSPPCESLDELMDSLNLRARVQGIPANKAERGELAGRGGRRGTTCPATMGTWVCGVRGGSARASRVAGRMEADRMTVGVPAARVAVPLAGTTTSDAGPRRRSGRRRPRTSPACAAVTYYQGRLQIRTQQARTPNCASAPAPPLRRNLTPHGTGSGGIDM